MKFSESTIYKDGLNQMRTLSNKVKNISVANRETLGNLTTYFVVDDNLKKITKILRQNICSFETSFLY